MVGTAVVPGTEEIFTEDLAAGFMVGPSVFMAEPAGSTVDFIAER
jgi:hypothetical protein